MAEAKYVHLCEHCGHRSTSRKGQNHHAVWNHLDQTRKLAGGRVLEASK